MNVMGKGGSKLGQLGEGGLFPDKESLLVAVAKHEAVSGKRSRQDKNSGTKLHVPL